MVKCPRFLSPLWGCGAIYSGVSLRWEHEPYGTRRKETRCFSGLTCKQEGRHHRCTGWLLILERRGRPPSIPAHSLIISPLHLPAPTAPPSLCLQGPEAAEWWGGVPDILVVRRTSRQGKRVLLCLQEPSLFLLSLSLYLSIPPAPLYISSFPSPSPPPLHKHTHVPPSLIDWKFIAKLGWGLMKSRLLANVSLFLILRSKTLIPWPSSDLLWMALHCHLDKVPTPSLVALQDPTFVLGFIPLRPPSLPHPHPQPFVIWPLQTLAARHALWSRAPRAFCKGPSLYLEDSVPFIPHPHTTFPGWILLILHLPHAFPSGSLLWAPATGQAPLLRDPITPMLT